MFYLPGRAPIGSMTIHSNTPTVERATLSDIWLPHIDLGHIAPFIPSRLWGRAQGPGFLELFGSTVITRFLTDEAAEKNQLYFLDALKARLRPGVISLEDRL